MSNKPKHCGNCGYDYQGKDYAYCPSCGQKRLSRLTIGSLFESLMSSFFSLDSRLYHTIVPFLLQPGKLAKDFIDGKRKTYMNPSQMYFFFSFVALLTTTSLLAKDWDAKLMNWITTLNENREGGGTISFDENGLNFSSNEDEQGVNDHEQNSLDSILTELRKDSVMQKQLETVENNINKRDTVLMLIEQGKTNEEIYYEVTEKQHRNFFNKGFSYFSYNMDRNKGKGFILTVFAQLAVAFPVALIVFTLLLKLFYIRHKTTIAEHFVFAVYFFSFCFFLLTYHVLAFYAFPNAIWITNISLLLVSLYFYKSLRNFYQQKRGKTILKYLLFTGVSGIIIPTIIFVLIFLLSLIRYT